MRVTKLALSGFRNIKPLEFSPGEGVNVIWGDNAQGKTNLLEALWLFCGAKSFRGARESEFIAFGEEYAALDLDFFAQNREQTARLRLSAQQRQVSLNGVKLPRLSQLSGAFLAVVFSPDHLELVKHEPRLRRSLLDTSLCQAYPKYAKVLFSYEKILRQRGHLLKDAQEHAQLLDLLEAWDQSLIEYGGYITWMRARYTFRLAQYAAEVYEGLSGGRERFSARYLSSCGELPAHPDRLDRQEITRMVGEVVRQSRGQDIRMGVTHMGPHRDDLEILVDGNSARAFGSQGQQRSCVLALKLAECRILEEGVGEPPVVLLDDVMSELDQGRRSYLLHQLEGRQMFVTCCDKSILGELGAGRVFHVEQGIIKANPAD